MFDTFTKPLAAPRYAPFSHDFVIIGEDLNGAACNLQVRDRWNGGEVRADLGFVAGPFLEGIRVSSVTTEAGVPTSIVSIFIEKATMEAMPLGSEVDGDVVLVYDVHIIPFEDGSLQLDREFVAFRGTFTIVSGSTQ